MERQSRSRFVAKPRNKVKDDPCTNEAVLNEQATICGDKRRIGKWIIRYWAGYRRCYRAVTLGTTPFGSDRPALGWGRLLYTRHLAGGRSRLPDLERAWLT